MMVEAVQAYVRLVDGLTRATRDKARAAAHDLFAQVGLEDVANDAEQRIGKLTEEILSASRANRELLEKLVASEVTKAASRLGFVRFEDLDEVREEIAELQAQLARQQAGGTPSGTKAGGATTSPARESPATRASAKKTPTTGTATATTATKSAAKRSTSKATGAAQRLAAEREAAPDPTPAPPRAPRARRAPATSPKAAPVPDPTADAGA